MGPGELATLAPDLVSNTPEFPNFGIEDFGIGGFYKKNLQLVPPAPVTILVKGHGFAGTAPNIELLPQNSGTKTVAVSNLQVLDDNNISFDADFTAAAGFTVDDAGLYKLHVEIDGECIQYQPKFSVAGSFSKWRFETFDFSNLPAVAIVFAAVDKNGSPTDNGIPAAGDISIEQVSEDPVATPAGPVEVEEQFAKRPFNFSSAGTYQFQIDGGGKSAMSPQFVIPELGP